MSLGTAKGGERKKGEEKMGGRGREEERRALTKPPATFRI